MSLYVTTNTSLVPVPTRATSGQDLRRPTALSPLLHPTLVHSLLRTAVDKCAHIPAAHSLQTQLPPQKVYIAHCMTPPRAEGELQTLIRQVLLMEKP